MRFVKDVRITIQYGEKFRNKLILHANDTQLTGDETDFTIVGKFVNKDKENDDRED